MRAVLERDFLSEIVRPRTFWFRSLAAVAVSVVVLGIAFDNHAYWLQAPDRAAREIFLGGAFTLLGLLAVLTPPTVVGSVLDERVRETLPLVLAAPVRPSGFALAKLLARSGTVFAWALGAVVPLTALLLLGGVSAGDIATLVLVAVGSVVEMAAFALWISTVSRRIATAAILAYLAPALRWGASIGFAALFLSPPTEPFRQLATPAVQEASFLLLSTTPLLAAGRLADAREYDREVQRALRRGTADASPVFMMTPRGPRYVPPPPPRPVPVPFAARHPGIVYLAWSLLFALAAVAAAGRRLAREAEPRSTFFADLFASVIGRGRRGGRNLRGSPPGEGNPMAWKESRLLNTAASRPLYYGVLLLLLLSVVVYLLACFFHPNARDMEEGALGVLAGHGCLLGLVAVVASAAGMAHERTTGTLDHIRASRNTPNEFFRGKALGVARGLGFLSLFPALLLIICLATGILAAPAILASVYALLLSLAFWTGTGLLCGMVTLRTGTAVSLAGGVYGIFMVGVPLLAALLGQVFKARDAAEFLVGLWPPGTAYLFPEAMLRWTYPRFPGSDWTTRLNDDHESAVFWTAVLTVAAVALHLLGPRLSARRFERERENG